jgi:chaperonin cofactor prefoldin
MTFTKNDISTLSKIIKTVVRSEVSNEVKDLKSTLSAEIKLSSMRIRSSINELEDKVKNVEVSMTTLQNDMTTVKSGVKKLRKDLEKTIGFFDSNDVSLHNKLNKTRSEIGLSEFNFA